MTPLSHFFVAFPLQILGAAAAQTQPQNTQSHQSQGGGLRHSRHSRVGIGESSRSDCQLIAIVFQQCHGRTLPSSRKRGAF